VLGWDSSVGVAAYNGLDGPGMKSRWAEILRTLSDWPWGPSSLLYKGYRISFPGIKWMGLGVYHPPPPSAEVKERVEMSLLPLWAFMSCSRMNFTLTFLLCVCVCACAARRALVHNMYMIVRLLQAPSSVPY
jgi:hypothetical protein